MYNQAKSDTFSFVTNWTIKNEFCTIEPILKAFHLGALRYPMRAYCGDDSVEQCSVYPVRSLQWQITFLIQS